MTSCDKLVDVPAHLDAMEVSDDHGWFRIRFNIR